MKKILIITGSLRKKSFNRTLAEYAAEIMKNQAEVTMLDYGDVPFYNQDEEFPTPSAVENARREVFSADGIWIFSPEYNSRIPGVLKNLLDWLSRPVSPASGPRESAVRGKVVTVSSAAGKSAGINVRKDLCGLLEKMSMQISGGEGTGIVLSPEAFAGGEMILSDEDKDALKRQAEELIAAVNRI